jgi:hypothetical protein
MTSFKDHKVTAADLLSVIPEALMSYLSEHSGVSLTGINKMALCFVFRAFRNVSGCLLGVLKGISGTELNFSDVPF